MVLILACLSVPALRYLENIARQPEDLKFQRIRASNKFFASNVGALGDDAAKSFMHWCGFAETSEQEDQFSVFSRRSFRASHPRSGCLLKPTRECTSSRMSVHTKVQRVVTCRSLLDPNSLLGRAGPPPKYDR